MEQHHRTRFLHLEALIIITTATTAAALQTTIMARAMEIKLLVKRASLKNSW